ncbi:MAG: exodeoxyribonuclease VII large subunit [Planctomycetota bacterium]|jgi:exodeoxyribonuclease VII large subunit|nr:exodeoxyribonuclease VII large subunit [Planctomycetota bacterium]
MKRGLSRKPGAGGLFPAGSARPAAKEPAAPESAPEALTVSELTRRIKALLEGSAGSLAVKGEVSGLKASPSGHVYFSLKDAAALIECVIWRAAAERIGKLPRDGDRVVARGRLSVYEPRGRYQLTVSSFAAGAGKGDLWLKFEEIRARLAAEGLFDPGRKKGLPAFPRAVGIVTSPSGAALRDMLKILARRAPGVRAILAPCQVQGSGAAGDIVRALECLDRWGGVEVIVVGRGGGSLEDLWPFNEEAVARAIAGARTPVVSAVGHETDFSLADFAADVRAATPSEAAERIVPDRADLFARLAAAAARLTRAVSLPAGNGRERLLRAIARRPYRRPEDLLMIRWQRLDDALAVLAAGAAAFLASGRRRLETAEARLSGLSPRGILSRGYALILDRDGRPLLDSGQTAAGDSIRAILHRGGLEAVVEKTLPASDP